MISRDVGIVATVAIVNLAIGRRTFMPSIFGKVATATFILTGVAPCTSTTWAGASVVVDVFIYASLAATIVSSLHYIWQRHARSGPLRRQASRPAAPVEARQP